MTETRVEHDPIQLSASSYPYLLLNPRGVRKAPRKERSYDDKPTLHAPGCKSLTRTSETKPVEVPTITLKLFDRDEVWYCRNCLAQDSLIATVNPSSIRSSGCRSRPAGWPTF